MDKFSRLKVKNFQSLADVDIELGDFTVVVGASSSGKSALLRSLKAVARNVGSPSAVRVGSSAFTSEVTMSSPGVGDTTVAIERGKSQSTYRVIRNGKEDVFAKSGRSVPPEVQMILALPEPDGPDLIFSSQIDPPFLLAETGSTAAKIFGDLTNVSRLHGAAREANRRRLEASKVLTIRKDDALSCAERLKEEYGSIRQEVESLRQAQSDLSRVREQAQALDRLRACEQDFHTIEQSLEQAQSRLDSLPNPVEISDRLDTAAELVRKRTSILAAVRDLKASLSGVEQAERVKAEAQQRISDLENEFRELLVQAGACPTCGQQTKELAHVH